MLLSKTMYSILLSCECARFLRSRTLSLSTLSTLGDEVFLYSPLGGPLYQKRLTFEGKKSTKRSHRRHLSALQEAVRTGASYFLCHQTTTFSRHEPWILVQETTMSHRGANFESPQDHRKASTIKLSWLLTKKQREASESNKQQTEAWKHWNTIKNREHHLFLVVSARSFPQYLACRVVAPGTWFCPENSDGRTCEQLLLLLLGISTS